MGERAGASLAVEQARLNLANLDLYLARYAHADTLLKLLRKRGKLTPAAHAQLLGLEAEYHDRTGDAKNALALYIQTQEAYEELGRHEDAFECHLEVILLRAAGASAEDVPALERALAAIWNQDAPNQHTALAWLTRATLEARAGREDQARMALDESISQARKSQKGEVLFRALEARAALHAAQGSSQLARRDLDEALALCEEAAAKLPRDLREVFWNDPARAKLRDQAKKSAVGQESLMRTQTSGNTGYDDRFRRISEITRDLAREHTLSAVLERVTDHAIAIVGAERGFIILTNDEGQIVAQTARGPKGIGEEQRFSRSIAEEVLRTGEPVIAKSAMDDARLREAASVHQLSIQSVACIPIRGVSIRQEAIGALYIETRLKRGHMFQQELPLLLAFADQAAIAIENARLLEQNAARNVALELANVSLKRSSSRKSNCKRRGAICARSGARSRATSATVGWSAPATLCGACTAFLSV
jgi:serine/threonine-protein kinase PknK